MGNFLPHEHELKIARVPFIGILDGVKTYEIRDTADRDFAPGDTLVLREFMKDPRSKVWGGTYTGRELKVVVSYITPGGTYGLPVNVCVMAIRPIYQRHIPPGEMTAAWQDWKRP